ncbi:Pseudouridine synthase family protein, putative isoform 1 [Hibiscus syriacus]|uniref:Pseudouridine synthase family protein, putative isoform 1 n=1 Tax=Hibiscus syriacus TaxID=106335 RepID=A0A6A3B7S4_HIBSY|nr:protein IQ-DOMAIN 31-like [Hibiscus syriacus]KAE8713264.1 Pseudouridine synthase family protein, putative isoform 1 [Hibiscus syriacus]
MGKASKWLRNFLIGRKDNEGKRKNVSVSFEDHGSSMANPPPSPLRRIWSFGKSASDVRVCKSSRSFNTMTASSIVNQAALDLENQHDNTRVLSMAAYETSLTSRAIKDDAARRIQASFRAYLARRALHALKGLVKLQALVRGHLVRKQTTATLRCMHALMSIQLQARVQRIRMASKPQLTPKSQLSTHGRLPLEMGFKREQKDEKNGAFKSKNGFTNRSKTERIEQGITRCFFDEISASKKKQNYEEFSFTTPNSPRHCPPLKSKPTTPGRSSFSSYEYPWMPKYMANTQSSRAKVRSQSEPKQRPASSFKAKGKRTASSEQTNDNNM